MDKSGHQLVASSLQGVECEEMVSCTPPAMESCLCDTVSMAEESIEEERERGEEEEEGISCHHDPGVYIYMYPSSV